MLGKYEALATIAVRRVDAVQPFYEKVLGLEPVEAPAQGVAAYRCGRTRILIYESQFAGTNKATAATFIVGSEIDGIVRDLKAKGVRFERYDLPGTQHEGDVHVAGNTRVAWLKDPEGNIIALVNG